MSAPDTADPPGWSPVGKGGAYALVLVLTVLLAVWGAFLVPFRVGGTLVPLCWLLALVGNVVLGRAGGRLLGKTGTIVVGLVWLVVAFTLGTKRSEGDLIVPGTTVGLVFLLAGAVASAVSYGLVVTRVPAPPR